MKKVKFTLGLLLSFLLIGVSANAQKISATATFYPDSSYRNISYGVATFNVVNKSFNYTDVSPISVKNIKNPYSFSKTNVEIYGNYVENSTTYGYIAVDLEYFNGLEVVPVVKRITTYPGFTYVDYISADSSWLKPYLDRKSGIAHFAFFDNWTELSQKFPVGQVDVSFAYEITINDEVGSPGADANQPPSYGETIILRGITLNPEAGITTLPNYLSGVHYTPSGKDYTFMVYTTASTIYVTTGRKHDEEGTEIVDNNDGSFKVTIKTVTSNLTVTIKSSANTSSGTGEDGTTGNDVFVNDAVWASGGSLFVKATAPGTLQVYSITGQLVKATNVTGSSTFSLAKGIYIVKLNGKAFKVIL
jgi:hypothetical protein